MQSRRFFRSSAALLLLATFRTASAQDALAAADDGFTVAEIRLAGLQRISEGTVYNYLPVNIGDRLDRRRIAEAVRALYATEFFSDVQLRRDGNALVVELSERPSIEEFTIRGNKDIKTEDLLSSLRNVGLEAGKPFDRSVLDEVTRFMTDQYFSRGKYAVDVDTTVEEVPGNKVRIDIAIVEGARDRIQQISIVGNKAFDDERLLDQLELRTSNLLSWYRQDDRYARETLTGDLENLRSYYMDRGYADFSIDSTQVALTPEKDDIFLTVNLTEGERYSVGDVKLAGELIVPEAELAGLLLIRKGDVYSRALITRVTELIVERLGRDGYAFAKVDPVPQRDTDTRDISLTFLVEPGNRVYVRRISFAGTSAVNDEVLRREMRQLEGGYLSNTAVERSKERLQRLPYVESAEVQTTPVPGTPDLVDVEFTIKDGLPGQFTAGIGYSESQSLMLNGSMVHSNFLGTGQRVAVELNGGQYSKVYEISHTDPYLTADGVSRTLSLSYRDVTQLVSSSSDFSTETLTAGYELGYPITENQRIAFGTRWQRAQLATTASSSDQLLDWVTRNGESFEQDIDGTEIVGSQFDALDLTVSWSFDSRDRLLFPNRGAIHRLNLTYSLPVGDVEYYSTGYDYRQYFRLPVLDFVPFSFHVNVGYLAALGDTTAVPPYRNLFLGGPDSVRGFSESQIGPRDSLGNPYGGDFSVSGQLEAILPMPARFAASARASVFYDFGQLAYLGDTRFTDKGGFPVEYGFKKDGFRTSTGVAVQWLAPLGLFRFSYAIPLTRSSATVLNYGDETEGFQFSIGSAF